MQNLTIEEWVVFIIGIISIIPTVVLFIQYLQTRLLDFLLFSGMFFSASVVALMQILLARTNTLIYFQINHILLTFTSLLFFIHSSRLIWDNIPKVIWYIGIIWFAILIFLTLFWELSNQPETAYVIFADIPAKHSTYFPKGAGLVTQGGVVIYSSAQPFLADCYRIFGACLLVYAYFTVKPVNPTSKILLSRSGWRIAAVLLLSWSIVTVPWFPRFTFINVLILVLQIIVAYIAIFIPETMLISHAQVLRARFLYEKVFESQRIHGSDIITMSSIVEYMNGLPIELLNEIQD